MGRPTRSRVLGNLEFRPRMESQRVREPHGASTRLSRGGTWTRCDAWRNVEEEGATRGGPPSSPTGARCAKAPAARATGASITHSNPCEFETFSGSPNVTLFELAHSPTRLEGAQVARELPAAGACAPIGVVLERHADQRSYGVLQLLGQLCGRRPDARGGSALLSRGGARARRERGARADHNGQHAKSSHDGLLGSIICRHKQT
jgi:hypothetical protein